MNENNNVGDRQWLKFGILAGILLIVVLVIALLRPLIFGRIVPAVMGDDGEKTAVDETVVEETIIIEEAPAETPVDNTTETDSTVKTETPVDGGSASEEEGVTNTPVVEEVVDEGADGEETAVSTITYTVKPGDTIYSIARKHNVSPAAIVAVNRLTDPNNILIGTELLIPQP